MIDSPTIIEAEGLTKVYAMGKVRVKALKEVTLSISRGSFLGITGSSGSGKSTLLNLIGGLDTPTSGTIRVHGKVLSRMSNEELAHYRRADVGMIFQSFNLISSLTAAENVALPLLFAGVAKKERRQRARDVLNKVGLVARADHRPLELSGGEQQRVAIARALVNHPEILLADEPTGNLDSRTSKDIVRFLSDLNRERSITVVLVSHEEGLIQEYCHMAIRLEDGTLASKDGMP